ncbi:MAG: hypothetical protein IPP85_15605 [Propionivibrio sp.]|nr:hypothetical protein [Propionivibrio sp.]
MDENDQNSHKNALHNEVLCKIGRNVLLFQQIEGILKFLVSNHHADGTMADFMERQQKRDKKVQKQMMGTLVEQYTEGILSDAGEPTNEPEDVTESWVSISFKRTGDKDYYDSQKADMKLMVDERNNLIHHFLSRWHPESVEHLAAASAYLDQQRDKVLPMLEHFKSFTKSMQESRQAMAAFLASDEGERQLELIWLQNSPLVNLLREVASQKARPDGWTYLSDAGRAAFIHEPDAVKHMKEQYGHSTLKRLLIASELFEVLDEPLRNGNFQTLFRLKRLVSH